MPKHATRRERKAASEKTTFDEEKLKEFSEDCRDSMKATIIEGFAAFKVAHGKEFADFDPLTADEHNYHAEKGFASREELICFCLRNLDAWHYWNAFTHWGQHAMIVSAAKYLWEWEKSYPSKAAIESQCARARDLAREVTAHLSGGELLSWVEEQMRITEKTHFMYLTEVTAKQAKRTKHLLPVPHDHSDKNLPEGLPTWFLNERYGTYALPNGELVYFPVAWAYMLEAMLRVVAAASRRRWHRAVHAVIRQNRTDAAANAANAAAADEQRRVRAQADAAAAAKQPRSYTAAGPSHKEGAAKWADEPPTATEAAKREVAKAASLEAKAAAIAAKKEAKAQATAERLEQLRCLHVAEEIGGSH